MSRRRIVIASSSFILLAATFVFAGRSYLANLPFLSEQKSVATAPATTTSMNTGLPLKRVQTEVESQLQQGVKTQAEAGSAVPEAVVYRHLFYSLALLWQKAEAEEQQGKDGSAYRSVYKQMAKLTEAQAKQLDEIAMACDREIKTITVQAKEVISTYRAHRQNAANETGETSAPYDELKGLEQKRDSAVLHARDRLREAFGEQEFKRFDEFVQQNIAAHIKVMTLDPKQPGTPTTPLPPAIFPIKSKP